MSTTQVAVKWVAVGDLIVWNGSAGGYATVIDTRGGLTIAWLGLDDMRHQATLGWDADGLVNVFEPGVSA